MRRVLPALLACALLGLACGDDDPTGPDPSTIPDIVGTYTGTWNNGASIASTGQEVQVSCPGSAKITEQDADGGFFGYWTQVGDDGCPGAAGTIGGRVMGGGELTITEFTNTTSPTLEEATGGQCTIVAGSNAFEGFIDGRTLEISRTARADCGTAEIVYSWELSATRTD